MEFGGEMWRNDSCRATKKKGKKKETNVRNKKWGGGKKSSKRSACFFPGFREEMLTRAVSRRPSKHYAGYRARGTRGMAQSARGPSISRVASRGTSRRKKFNYNLRLMGVEEGGRKRKGKNRRRSFEIVRSPPAVAVSGGGRIIAFLLWTCLNRINLDH